MRPNRQIAPVACSLVCEFMHFCCHVDENWFVRNAPFVNTIGTVAFLGFFIFAMWLFPEVKRDETAGGVRRDAPSQPST